MFLALYCVRALSIRSLHLEFISSFILVPVEVHFNKNNLDQSWKMCKIGPFQEVMCYLILSNTALIDY